LYLHPSYYLFYIELFISISCVLTSTFISKSVIISSSSPILTGWLYALYRSAINIIFTALSLIFNYPSLELTVAIHRGLPTRCPLFYIPCDPYIPIQSGNIVRCHFWPIKAWDGWPSPPVLKVGNAGKVPASP
jgi:hypothetical protein